MSDFVRTTRSNPCKVCGKHGWCSVTADGAVAKCMYVEEGAFKSAEDGSGLAYFHRLIDDPDWRSRPRTDRPKPAPREPKASIAELALTATQNTSTQTIDKLAEELGLSRMALINMGVGWARADQLQALGTKCKGPGCWTFPMRDKGGEQIIGVRLRSTDGFKYAVDGSMQGIFVPHELGQSGKPIVIVTEGPTDCAALLDMGFDAIGRPSNTAGTDLIRNLIITRTNSCKWGEVVILIDRDKIGSDAARNTWRGARKLAEKLVSQRRSVRICQPPAGIKDARDWLNSGAGEDDVMAVIDAEEPTTVRRFDWMKKAGAA